MMPLTPPARHATLFYAAAAMMLAAMSP